VDEKYIGYVIPVYMHNISQRIWHCISDISFSKHFYQQFTRLTTDYSLLSYCYAT